MLVPKESQDLYVGRNATAVLAILTLASFMALTAMLLILSYDRFPDAPGTAPSALELPSN
jgi:hypothetical protein